MNIYHHNGLFIESSSLREYYKIITEAISLNRKRQKRSSSEFIYYENHHVLPRSMFPEFQLEKWNKVLLILYVINYLLCLQKVIANERCLTHIGIWQQEQMKK